MKAADHTRTMLTAWKGWGVDRADLAVLVPDGGMFWQRDRPLEELPLAWPRAANVHGAEVYIRPARGHDWPLVFLDDVAVPLAVEVAHRHDGLAVLTSARGGCHLWLPCARPLDEQGRCRVQRWLAGKFGADPASISGEHLGRLAGFRNWKRCGCWVNVLAFPSGPRDVRRALEVPPDLPEAHHGAPRSLPGPGAAPPSRTGRDASPSGQDWAWVCNMLEAGMDPEKVCRELIAMARSRRGADTERYAQRTVDRAMVKVGRRLH